MVESKAKVVESKGSELAGALQGTAKERLEEERTIVLTMTAGQRPVVNFTGFWSGKFIRAAMDSIARAYRLRRNSASRPIGGRKQEQVAKPAEGGKGDVKQNA